MAFSNGFAHFEGLRWPSASEGISPLHVPNLRMDGMHLAVVLVLFREYHYESC